MAKLALLLAIRTARQYDQLFVWWIYDVVCLSVCLSDRPSMTIDKYAVREFQFGCTKPNFQ